MFYDFRSYVAEAKFGIRSTKFVPFLASDQPVLRIRHFYRVDRQFMPIRLRETTEGVACLRRGLKAERESGVWLTSQRARRTIRL